MFVIHNTVYHMFECLISGWGFFLSVVSQESGIICILGSFRVWYNAGLYLIL